VAVNLSERPVTVGGLDGRVLIATDRDLDGHPLRGRVELMPWEGVVVG
jgi:hypothetical protein